MWQTEQEREPRRAASRERGRGIRVETPVAYVCGAPSHQAGDGGGPDKLTVHEGKWAFCPHDAKAGGHEWKPTGGIAVSKLRHATAFHEKDASKERTPAR